MNTENQPQLTSEDALKIKNAMIGEIVNKPPTIGLVGVSGTGKSSTINAMFKTDLPISHVVGCTKEFRDEDLPVNVTNGNVTGEQAVLRVVDAPGLGEDVALDPKYLKMYHSNLSDCDVILWVLTARNRAIALDQMYLQQLGEYTDKMIFGINQVDLVEPMDWNPRINLPSSAQEEHIEIILSDRKKKLESVVEREIKIVPYSAKVLYNLQELFTTIVESCPEDRAWIFSAIKGFRPEDFIPSEIRDEVMKRANNDAADKPKKRWFR